MNERTTTTPVSASTGAGDATSAEQSQLCDWWPWMYVITLDGHVWCDRTPLPRPAVSTYTL